MYSHCGLRAVTYFSQIFRGRAWGAKPPSKLFGGGREPLRPPPCGRRWDLHVLKRVFFLFKSENTRNFITLHFLFLYIICICLAFLFSARLYFSLTFLQKKTYWLSVLKNRSYFLACRISYVIYILRKSIWGNLFSHFFFILCTDSLI